MKKKLIVTLIVGSIFSLGVVGCNKKQQEQVKNSEFGQSNTEIEGKVQSEIEKNKLGNFSDEEIIKFIREFNAEFFKLYNEGLDSDTYIHDLEISGGGKAEISGDYDTKEKRNEVIDKFIDKEGGEYHKKYEEIDGKVYVKADIDILGSYIKEKKIKIVSKEIKNEELIVRVITGLDLDYEGILYEVVDYSFISIDDQLKLKKDGQWRGEFKLNDIFRELNNLRETVEVEKLKTLINEIEDLSELMGEEVKGLDTLKVELNKSTLEIRITEKEQQLEQIKKEGYKLYRGEFYGYSPTDPRVVHNEVMIKELSNGNLNAYIGFSGQKASGWNFEGEVKKISDNEWRGESNTGHGPLGFIIEKNDEDKIKLYYTVGSFLVDETVPSLEIQLSYENIKKGAFNEDGEILSKVSFEKGNYFVDEKENFLRVTNNNNQLDLILSVPYKDISKYGPEYEEYKTNFEGNLSKVSENKYSGIVKNSLSGYAYIDLEIKDNYRVVKIKYSENEDHKITLESFKNLTEEKLQEKVFKFQGIEAMKKEEIFSFNSIYDFAIDLYDKQFK